LDKKFIEEIDLTDYEVLTPTGFQDFDGICKTVPYAIWTLETESGLTLQCADHHLVMSNGTPTHVTDLAPGDSLETESGSDVVKSITVTGDPEPMYDLRNVVGGVYYTNGIASHNTTLVSVYALWYAIFHEDKTLGIASNKQASAVDILNRFKTMYEELPVWLKPGVKEYQKLGIEFENGTRILVSGTSADTYRGRSLNVAILDEFASVPKGIQDKFWAANYPTISQSVEGKIIVISTPKGWGDLFHKIFTEGERGENTFTSLRYDWRAVPWRDEAWAKAQLKNLGSRKFAQEHLTEFIGSIDTVINKETLESLFFDIRQPQKTEFQGHLSIYEYPEPGKIYVLGVDPSKGTGANSSCIQVLRVDNTDPFELTQVAVFLDNRTSVYLFADICCRLGEFYNHGFLLAESNGEGSALVHRLWYELEYENMLHDRASNRAPNSIGMRATVKNKPQLVLFMKRLLESGKLHLCDKDTIEQLATFIEYGQSFRGKDNSPDDCVSALYWGTWFFKMDVLDKVMSMANEPLMLDEDSELWTVMTDDDFHEEIGDGTLWD